MSSLPSFETLKEVLTRTFTLVPAFVPERETLFIGLDEDSEPIHDQRLNYTWDGKSKLALFSARRYSDGSVVNDDDISLQVASSQSVRFKICIHKRTWDEGGQFRCCFSIIQLES